MQAVLGGSRGLLAARTVEAALSLARGATTRDGVDVLDATGRPTGQVLRVRAGGGSSVTWSFRPPDRTAGQAGGAAAVRRRARLLVEAGQGSLIALGSQRLRVWTEWLTSRSAAGDEWARFDLGVFVVTNPGALEDDGLLLTRTLDLADKTYLWSQRQLSEPLHVPAGTAVLDYVRTDLGSRFGETRFALPTSTATLPLARTFERGTPLLQVYGSLLEAVGLDQLTADESGLATTAPLAELAARAVEHVYGAGRGKVLPQGQLEPLLPVLPNVLRFSARQGPSLGNAEGNGLRTLRNQSTGPASIDARGFEVELRVDVEAADQQSLDAVAAADAQLYFAGGGERWRGTVGLNPLHSDRDVIGLVLPRLGLAAGPAWLVTEWTYPLGARTDQAGATMPITAERRV